MSERVRLFIAVPLSPEVEGAVKTVLATWKEKAPGVRWVRPEGAHITLKFLGEVSGERVQGIAEVTEAVAKGHHPFRVTLRGAGGFPSPSKARVLWLGVEDPEGGLTALFHDLEEALMKLGFPREERPFKPHLTLGRVKGGGKSFPFLRDFSDRAIGVLEVKEVVLFRSDLRPTGAEYTPLAVATLGGCRDDLRQG